MRSVVDHPVDDLVDRPVESGLLRADPIRELLVRAKLVLIGSAS